MLLPYNTLKQSKYNLSFRRINKSMTLTSVIKWNWEWYCIKFRPLPVTCGSMAENLSIIKEKLSLKVSAKNIPNFSIKCLSVTLTCRSCPGVEMTLNKISDHHLSSYKL